MTNDPVPSTANLSQFIGDPTDAPAPNTITDDLLTKIDNLIVSHPMLSRMRERLEEMEQRLDEMAKLVAPAEIHVRPQDPDEKGDLPPGGEDTSG